MYIDLITIDLCPGQGGGVRPSETLEISSNGVYDVYSYASASVSVPFYTETLNVSANNTYYPGSGINGFSEVVVNVPQGVDPSGTLDITSNGMYDVYLYSSASVSVHPSNSLSETYTTNGTKTITGEFNGGTVNVDVHPTSVLSETYRSNGIYNITGEFNGGEITIEVPAPQFITETLSVSSNGTYIPSVGVNGFSEVIVNVSHSGAGFTEKEITEGIQIVDLNNSASFVGYGVFAFDSNIQTIDLSLCKYVGSNAFNGCYNISNISLPVCESLYSRAFEVCSSLSQVYLPVCKTIKNSVFQSCSSLSQVYLPVCKTIDNSVFKNCSNLLEVNLPECETIGVNAFGECILLSSISLPACKKIGANAFQGAFQSAAISSVNLVLPVCSIIEGSAFYWTRKLATITLLSNSVCSLHWGAFSQAGLSSIYVPASLVDAYKSASNWSTYSSIIFPISE